MSKFWKYLIAISTFILIVVIGIFAYRLGQRSMDDKVSSLAGKLTQAEKTVEITKDVYATKIVELGDQITDALKLLNGDENKRLRQELDDAKAKILTFEAVDVHLKHPISGKTESTQVEIPANEKSSKRIRVDFSKDLGPFLVKGFTMTDPGEGFLELSQVRPLSMTVLVSQNKDGSWASSVTSSDPDIGVNVRLGSVNANVLKPSWIQRIWLSSSFGVWPDRIGSLGVEYRGDRFSFGPSCQLSSQVVGCGVNIGLRLAR